MTNDPRLDEYHNYRFEMYCADQAEITSLRTQLAEVARERDLLRAALIDCAVPLEVLHAIDCELAPATQAGITAAIAAIRSALFSAEPKPEAPKCGLPALQCLHCGGDKFKGTCKCNGTGRAQ